MGADLFSACRQNNITQGAEYSEGLTTGQRQYHRLDLITTSNSRDGCNKSNPSSVDATKSESKKKKILTNATEQQQYLRNRPKPKYLVIRFPTLSTTRPLRQTISRNQES